MSEFKRIDPAAIPDLFRKHGMLPWQGVFHCELPSGPQCCCVNTILAAEVVGRESAIRTAWPLQEYGDVERLTRHSGLDPVYAEGLAKGWDRAGIYREMPELEVAGYADGIEAWLACQPLRREGQR